MMRWSIILKSALILLLSIYSMAAQSVIIFSDDFETLLTQWTVNSSGGDASIGNETSNSGNNSLRLRWDTVTITSNTINANVSAAQVRIWVRRGDDNFSENPENGET